MNDTVIVNDKTLLWLFIERGFKIPSFNFEVKTEEVPGRSGSVYQGRELKQYEFELPMIIRNDYLSHSGIKSHDDILNELVKFFNYDNQVKLQFKSKQWYWNAYFEGPIELFSKTENSINIVNLKVVLTDPYKYSAKGSKNTAISDAVSVVNTGTADTPIVVEARALKDSTNFLIAKGEQDYFMIGKSEDAYRVNKDIEPFRFNDEFNTVGLKNWAYMPNDTTFGNLPDGGDAMGGKFALSDLKESIYPSEWGNNTKTNWHGAALYKSLGSSVQDFRIRFKVILRQHVGVGPGKAVAYVVDENNRTMFSMTYVNTAVDKNESSIIVYAYNEHGEARRIYNRLIPFKYHRAKNAHVFMYLERKGLDIKITNFRYDIDTDPNRTKPIDKDVVVVRDEGKFYQRPARIARMYIGKSAKHTNYMAINILGFSLQELLPKQSDITPIEIRQGDLIQIDTHAKSVTINGDDALKLKDFGSNYFNVESGHNELVISPPETFDTTVKWQDRWL